MGIYNVYAKGAQKRGLPWELTPAMVDRLVARSCHYCGAPPRGLLNGRMVYNGIDRIDNLKGYTRQNSVSCCSTCNYAKRTMTYSQFIAWIRQVYAHSLRMESQTEHKPACFD